MSEKSIKLLITGKMGSGKGFCASFYAIEYGAQGWSRTELMKRLAHAVIDHNGSPDAVLERVFLDVEQRDQVRRELLLYADSYIPEPGKPRRMYQDITEICMEHDPLCFERELDARIRASGENSFSLIDDVRSRAAFEYFVSRGYSSLRIDASEETRRKRMLERDGYLPSEETFLHSSETDLDDVVHDFVVSNEGDDLEAFYAALRAVPAALRS